MIGPLGDRERLLHILDASDNIEAFSKDISEEDFLKNILVRSAVERQLEIIGEAASLLSEELRGKYPEIEWHKIKGLRNIIAHEYFGVSAKQVWYIIEVDLPMLKEKMTNIFKNI